MTVAISGGEHTAAPGLSRIGLGVDLVKGNRFGPHGTLEILIVRIRVTYKLCAFRLLY